MAHFIETYKKGKEGRAVSLDTGSPALNKAINGLQQGMSIGLAAAPKCGKTTAADFFFLINPYLYALQKGILDNVEWVYFSYEIDRVRKEFKFAAFFMAHDYQQYNVMYKEKIYGMSKDYLMGTLVHEQVGDSIDYVKVTPEHEVMLKTIYKERIIPLFGEYSLNGVLLKAGKITFIEEPENPTGLDKFLKLRAKSKGKFRTSAFNTTNEKGQNVIGERLEGYTPNNPDLFTIILTDHMRKLRRERGFSMKDTIDKWLEYSTHLRNLCNYTFIHIIHSNRNLANPDRLRAAGEWIFPSADDCKDSGNPAEECTLFMTLFNPNDEKYNLTKHFGHDLEGYPNYRSLHITESRDTECPVHLFFNMLGGINTFTPLNGY